MNAIVDLLFILQSAPRVPTINGPVIILDAQRTRDIDAAVALLDHDNGTTQGYYRKVETVQDAIYEKACALDNQDVPLEEWANAMIESLTRAGFAIVPVDLPHELLGEAATAGVYGTGNPKHCWDFLVLKSKAYPSITAPVDPCDGIQRGNTDLEQPGDISQLWERR